MCGEDNTKQVRVSLTDTKIFMAKLPFWAGVPDGDSPSRREGKCPWFDIVSEHIIADTQINLLKSKRYRFWIQNNEIRCNMLSLTDLKKLET